MGNLCFFIEINLSFFGFVKNEKPLEFNSRGFSFYSLFV